MKKIFLVLLGIVLVGNVVVSAEIVPPAPDFRIAAQTNKTLYHNKDLLDLSVMVFNDGNPLKINPIIPPAPATETGATEPALLDDEPVDVLIQPNAPSFVGTAKIIPLFPAAPAIAAPEPVIYRLPLFGQPRVSWHSSQILARTHILVALAPQQDEGPAPGDTNPILEKPKVPAIGVFYAPGPGDYLVQVNITTIEGTPLAQAEKIIRIAPRQPNPAVMMAAETNKIVKIIDGKVTKDLALDSKTDLTVTLNKNYLMQILRYIVGLRPAATTATTTTVTR